MKKNKLTKIIVISVLVLHFLIPISIWMIKVQTNYTLSIKYGEEFKDLSFDHMGLWVSASDLRVLHYSKDDAIVYYFSDYGGEVISFSKENNIWIECETIALWSAEGSADDYIIWPYFKNWGMRKLYLLNMAYET